MKKIIENIIRKRNPQFRFDPSIDFRLICGLFLTTCFSYLRGFKLLLRGKYMQHVFLGRGVCFFNLRNIYFGKWVKIGAFSFLSGLGKGKLSLGNNVSIGAFSRLVISTSFNQIGEHIHIGDNVGIGEYAYLGGAGGLILGSDCIIGQYFSCHPENHIFSDISTLIRHQGVTRSGIIIGKNCWIGAKVTICDGVEIGENCVIAAGAVVTKSMPAHSLIGGVPAKIIRSIASN
jgi:acetyltransferase-like isoleucine patch superfamily enzyme